ncbi:MAG: hypothetical protein ACI9IL_000698 [Rickettsiales bacterium]|jgi:hypothetical protein
MIIKYLKKLQKEEKREFNMNMLLILISGFLTTIPFFFSYSISGTSYSPSQFYYFLMQSSFLMSLFLVYKSKIDKNLENFKGLSFFLVISSILLFLCHRLFIVGLIKIVLLFVCIFLFLFLLRILIK